MKIGLLRGVRGREGARENTFIVLMHSEASRGGA